MVNLTELLGRQLRDGDKNLGIISALLFDNLTKTCLLETDEGIFTLDKTNARWDFVAANAWAFENEQLTKTVDRQQLLRKLTIGQKIVDQNGEDVGEVADVELNCKLVIKQILSSTGNYLKRSDVVAVGDVVITRAKSIRRIVQDELRKERVLNKLLSPSNQQHATAPAKITQQPIVTATAETASTREASAPVIQPQSATTVRAATSGERTIRRRYGDFSFLIGKSVDKTITNFQGEVMIRQHETINLDVLRQAKISGKLLELYLHIE